MSIIFELYEKNGKQPYDTVDFGLTRKTNYNILETKLKNIGSETAYGVVISSLPFNSKDEVSSEEYVQQQLAASWKQFSLSESGPYENKLNLGTIAANKFLEGTEKISVNLSSQSMSSLTAKFTSGEVVVKDNKLILNHLGGDQKDGTAVRFTAPYLNETKNTEVEFNADFVFDQNRPVSSQIPMILFPVRLGSKGDGFGYLFMVQYKRDNSFLVSIWKDGFGIDTHYDRVYGTKIFDSGSYRFFDKNKKFHFKVYNNQKGEPSFEILYGGENLKLGAPGAPTSEFNIVQTDKNSNAYFHSGKAFLDVSMETTDISVSLSNIIFTVEQPQQSIFIRTKVGSGAESGKDYKAAIALKYEGGK